MSHNPLGVKAEEKAWMDEARRTRDLAGQRGKVLDLIGQPPNIEIRLSRGDRQVLQVFLPPAALRWLDDHGMGIEYLADALSGTTLERLIALQGTPEESEPSTPDVQLRDRDGRPQSPGVIYLESWVKAHAGQHTLRAIVQAIYGVAEDAADAMLYERRGTRHKKAGTRFYSNFIKDLHAACQALQTEGWLITSPTGRGSGGDRFDWNFLAPPALADGGTA